MQIPTLDNLLNYKELTFNTNLTAGDIVLVLIMTLLTSLIIAYVYRRTYSGVLYSENFTTTIFLSSLVGAVIMMAIGGNLALSLGMVRGPFYYSL